ncbi:hypothetical protein EYZ11_007094 [Aspergillus tanneri]|uniref:Uncharacterized protein n=1 Tax=Aspergillus tanneri TaxID=1220188 RepID=A0A4S3JEC3_9EURO|nr:hypothetical protein EYZ11_007094 [Aspergillus tanneri]
MCYFWICKFTLCGCIWDEWFQNCGHGSWCYKKRLVQTKYDRSMCEECCIRAGERFHWIDLMAELEYQEKNGGVSTTNLYSASSKSQEVVASGPGSGSKKPEKETSEPDKWEQEIPVMLEIKYTVQRIIDPINLDVVRDERRQRRMQELRQLLREEGLKITFEHNGLLVVSRIIGDRLQDKVDYVLAET